MWSSNSDFTGVTFMRTAHRRKRTGGRHWASLAASLALMTLTAGCSDILEVDLPGRVADSDLDAYELDAAN